MVSSQRVTIHDVAREAGVSISTVSKALNDVNVVKPKTKNTVLEIAKKMNYVPNLMGKQLKKSKTGMIGFYTSSLTGPYFSVLVEAISKEAEKRGYSINVLVSGNKQVIMNNILGGMVDGIIGFEEIINKDDLNILKSEQVKAVFIDRHIKTDNIGSVVFDSFQKSKESTEYLINLGHRKIVFLKGYAGTYDSDERLKGYKHALKEAGIVFNENLVIDGRFEEVIAYKEIIKFFKIKKESLPTAFLAGNDLSAIGTIKALMHLGYKVPDDFSVSSFDGIDLLNYFSPKITTVKNPIIEQGKLVVNHLIDLLEGKCTAEAFILEGKLIKADSTKEHKGCV